MHEDGYYWIWWIDTWLQGGVGFFFFSDLIPVTSHFQVWKLLWYLYSGLAHFVRRCITWRREPGRVFGGDRRLLPPQGCCLARAAHPALPCKTRGPARSTGVGLHTLFRFQAGLYRDQSEFLPAGKLWNVSWTHCTSWAFRWREQEILMKLRSCLLKWLLILHLMLAKDLSSCVKGTAIFV